MGFKFATFLACLAVARASFRSGHAAVANLRCTGHGTGVGYAGHAVTNLRHDGHAYATEIQHHTAPHYDFEYAVNDPHTGDVKSQQETRVGDVVKGSYSLNEPDGTKRIVHYTADDVHGFKAHVERIGTPVHPVPVKVAHAGYRHRYAAAPIPSSAHGYGYKYGYGYH